MTKALPVVCVGGASANIDAYVKLLRNLPADFGVAVVIINHLTLVNYLLLEALPHANSMPVELIRDGLEIKANHVYISEGERDLHILNGRLRLKPISKPTGWPNVITVFLRSLTRHWRGQLIVVIYSGYDGDGAAALRGVKDSGGIVMVETAETAKQPDMPLTAMASGCVDFVLSIEGIAREIRRIFLAAMNQRLQAAGAGAA
jgi:two-component system chemotaxis response regulator CheB